MQAKDNPEGIYEPDVIALTQALVRIPSENPPANYGPISSFIYDILSQTGAEVVIMEGQPGKPNVAALLRGADPAAPTLLLDGHMDVVPAGDPAQWAVDPYGAEIHDGQIWGRGTLDMKGSLASQMQAFMAVARSGKLAGNLIFAATCDDETAGKMGMGYVFPAGFEAHGWPRPSFHVLGEANQLNVTTAFKGRIWVEVQAKGKNAHGGAPHNGINAIEPVAAAGPKLRALMSGDHPLVGHDTFNFGIIQGGTLVNMVPDHCAGRFDMRFGPHYSTTDIEAGVQQVLDSVAGDATMSYEIFERREPLSTDPSLPPIVLLRECVAAVTGRQPEIQGFLAAGDLIYTANHGIPGVYMGPGDPAFFHVVNERIPIDELVQAARIYVRFARLYLGAAESAA